MREAQYGACVCAKSLELSQTLCELMDCSLSGSSVQGIPQAGILDGLPRPPPGDRPDQGIKPMSLLAPTLAGGFFFLTTRTTWEAQFLSLPNHKRSRPS